ncbi:hypothetical protein AMTR_s00093p00047340 [Amborella trichopoda]|uniref:Uncharacterized protein n=1 Tax=Amborella trichopoda TaxID=13333 RepID=W1NVT4_AMBTC|nr:hypothetical protein AMTR_s00093p00047340 [Amborella trichopoda]
MPYQKFDGKVPKHRSRSMGDLRDQRPYAVPTRANAIPNGVKPRIPIVKLQGDTSAIFTSIRS